MPASATEATNGNSTAAANKPSEKKQEGADQPLSPELVDLAVAELRYQTAFYLEAVQAMMDGVTLGAEQVQDKSIEFLQAGPTTDSGAAIAMFVLTLVLEGTIGPTIAGMVTKVVLRPMLRSTARAINAQKLRNVGRMEQDIRLFRQDARYFSGSKSIASPGDSKFLDQMSVMLEKQAKILEKQRLGSLAEATEVSDSIDKITNFVQNNLVALAKVPAAEITDVAGTPTLLQEGNSPGVEVRAAAMASAARWRLMVVATHEALEVELKQSGLTLGQVQAILNGYRADTRIDIAQLREHWQLVAEAMIWARLLLDLATTEVAIDRTERASGRDLPSEIARQFGNQGLVDAPFLKFGQFNAPKVDEKLMQYLFSRFRKELERWIAMNDKVIPIRETWLQPSGVNRTGRNPSSLPPGWWNKLSNSEREDFLVQYFAEIMKKIPTFKLRM